MITTLHYNIKDYQKHTNSILTFTKLSHIDAISRSVSYQEARFFEYEDYSDVVYPQLKPVSYMKFIYE